MKQLSPTLEKLTASATSTPVWQRAGALVLFILLFLGAIWLAGVIAQDPLWQTRVASAGYGGVFLAGLIGGLNFIVPVPPATLSPLFIASGLQLQFIILSLALGTLAADYIGYLFGSVSRSAIQTRYPTLFARFTHLGQHYRWYLLPLVTLYAALVPFPNEAMVIPLALAGVRFRFLLPALIVGNCIHQFILVYSVLGIASY